MSNISNSARPGLLTKRFIDESQSLRIDSFMFGKIEEVPPKSIVVCYREEDGS